MFVELREKGHGYSKAAAEVCKYALKFGDLSVEKTWEAFKVLKGKRLTGSFGLLWGVKIPDRMTDDMPEGDLPYLEMLYKFAYGKQSYYDLVAVKQVEPQANDRMRSEEEGTTDRHDRMRDFDVAITDERGVGAGCASSHSEPAPQFVLPTGESTTDAFSGSATNPKMGRFLYNIDLSIYVENRLTDFIG